MDSTPQVRVDGSEVQNTDTPMTQATLANTDIEGAPDTQQDIILPDVQSTEADSSRQTEEAAAPPRKPIQFLDFLTSPIVELVVGTGDKKTCMTAHQSLLVGSSFLSDKVKAFIETGPRRIELPDEDVEAFGYFLQYQYTRDYCVPHTQSPTSSQEQREVVGEIDDSGEQLLKHARVYTLAEKLGIPALKTLAHSKIHRINSSPIGELAYARYVYANTPAEDETIRKPVSQFWGLRSHVLRHEAEEEWRKICLEVPEFCFDVLTFTLDQKEKRAQDKADAESAVKGSGRKRLRSGI